MTTILALESATGPCSAAIWKGGHIAAYAETASPVMQSAKLLPMVEEVLSKSNTSYSDLSAVAATVGPGSFTGIRVALAAARGICLAAGIKGLGFTTLDVLAYGASQQSKKPALAILNAGKGEYYYQFSSGNPQIGTLEAALAEAGKDIFIAGNAPGAHGLPFPRADILAMLAATHPSPLPLTPFYIRPPDAKLPSKII